MALMTQLLRRSRHRVRYLRPAHLVRIRFAIGTNANVRSSVAAPGTSSIAIGYGANTGSGTDTGVLSAIAMGTSARATADYAAAIGIKRRSHRPQFPAIGNSSTSTLATKAPVRTPRRWVCGLKCQRHVQHRGGLPEQGHQHPEHGAGRGEYLVGLRQCCDRHHQHSVGAEQRGDRCQHTASGQNSMALGRGSNASATGSIAQGNSATASGVSSTAIGAGAGALADSSLALGVNAQATRDVTGRTGGIAIGTLATAGNNDSSVGNSAAAIAIGGSARSDRNSVALGNGAQALNSAGLALGSMARVTADNAVALGFGSTNDRASTVSVGTAGGERQIVNVAAATADTDAVILSQLKDSAQSAADALGGGSTVNANGTITAPRYYVGGTIYNSVGAALTNLDGRTATNTTNIDTNTSDINSLKTGKAGLVQQSAAGANLTVGKNTDGAAVSVAGTAGNRVVTGVAAGAVSSSSADAVNGSQLFATNTRLDTAEGNITDLTDRVDTAESNITTIQGDIGDINTSIGDINTNVSEIDARVTVNEGDINDIKGEITNVQGDITSIQGDITDINTSVTNIEGSVSSLTTQINNGSVGLVKQAAAGDNLTVGAATDGAAVDFTGTAGERKLAGVAEGALASDSTEAVNGSQLFATNTRLDTAEDNIVALDSRMGGAEDNIGDLQEGLVSVEGSINTINDSISTVNTNISNLDGRVTTVDNRVTTVEGTVNNLSTQINSGALGLVQQDADTLAITVAGDKGGNLVDFSAQGGVARTLTGVAAGALSADSKDAVNGSQLFATNERSANWMVAFPAWKGTSPSSPTTSTAARSAW